MQEVQDLIEVPAYTFVFHAVAEHSTLIKVVPPSKLQHSSNCGSFSRLQDATTNKLTRSTQSFSSLLMGRSLDNTAKIKLNQSRKEAEQLSKELAHYKKEAVRLLQRVEQLETEKEGLENYLKESVQLSDSLIEKYDSLTRENEHLKKRLTEQRTAPSEHHSLKKTELLSQDSKESLDSLPPPTPKFNRDRKTPSPTEQDGEGELCKAIADYIADNPDMLSLQQGDLVWVTSEHEGWLFGENINSGATGLFPPDVIARSSEM